MSERLAAVRVAPVMLASFFLVFAGPGAIQGFLRNLLPGEWSRLKVTSILAALYFSFMLWRIFVVSTQRAIGDKWSFVLGLASYLVVPVALLFTTNYAVLIGLAFVWGWGSASLWQTGPVWLYDATGEKRRGLWAGILYMLVFLGLILGARFQGYAAALGNRAMLLAAAILPGALAVALSAALPGRSARAEKLSLAGIRTMMGDRRVALLGALLFISATAYGLLLSAFRDRIDNVYGANAVGLALSAYFATRLVVSIAGGHFSDLMARRTVMAGAFLLGGAALAAATAWQGPGAFLLAAGCLGLVSGVVPVSATAFSTDWFAPEKRSLALGSAFFWQDCGMVTSLLAGQYVAQATGGFTAPFLLFAALFLISSALTLVLPREPEIARRAAAP